MLLKTKIPFNYVFGKIKYELVCVVAYSLLVWELYEHVHSTRISIPLSVPAILGTVLSLLLGFRSNQAYDRWWEARHIWGAIVNDSRTLARQVLVFMQADYKSADVRELKEKIIKRQIAWAFSLGQMLRAQSPTQGLEKYLDDDDMRTVSRYTNVPAAILNLHARDLQEALNNQYLNRFQQVEIDRTLSRLCDAQGKCERIKNTVFPSTYGLYIHFSLILFILLLPFGIIDIFGVMVMPVVVAISSCFILIEKMAIHLQDPFENKPTDTPVTTIAKGIERDLKQMMWDEAPRIEPATATVPNGNAGFYVM
jgi:putative membrane protein